LIDIDKFIVPVDLTRSSKTTTTTTPTTSTAGGGQKTSPLFSASASAIKAVVAVAGLSSRTVSHPDQSITNHGRLKVFENTFQLTQQSTNGVIFAYFPLPYTSEESCHMQHKFLCNHMVANLRENYSNMILVRPMSKEKQKAMVSRFKGTNKLIFNFFFFF